MNIFGDNYKLTDSDLLDVAEPLQEEDVEQNANIAANLSAIIANDGDINDLQNVDINLQSLIIANSNNINQLTNIKLDSVAKNDLNMNAYNILNATSINADAVVIGGVDVQSQIDSNDAEILALQNEDVNLQNQITTLDTGITDLQIESNDGDVNLQNQIDSNDTEISTLGIKTENITAITGETTIDGILKADVLKSATEITGGAITLDNAVSISGLAVQANGVELPQNVTGLLDKTTNMSIINGVNTIFENQVLIGNGTNPRLRVDKITNLGGGMNVDMTATSFTVTPKLGLPTTIITTGISTNAVELPAGDIQGQIDAISSGTTSDLNLKMDKVATTNLEMSGFGILDAGGITCSGSVSTGNIIPGGILPTSTYDIGESNKTYRNAYLSGKLTCGLIDCSNNVVTGNVLPKTAGKDIGSASDKYRDAYITGTLDAGVVVLPSGDVQTQLTDLQDKTQNITAVIDETTLAGKLVVSTIEAGGGTPTTGLVQDDFTGALKGGGLLSGNQAGYPLKTTGLIQLIDEASYVSGLEWGSLTYDTQVIGSLTNTFSVKWTGYFTDLSPNTDGVGFYMSYGATRTGTIVGTPNSYSVLYNSGSNEVIFWYNNTFLTGLSMTSLTPDVDHIFEVRVFETVGSNTRFDVYYDNVLERTYTHNTWPNIDRRYVGVHAYFGGQPNVSSWFMRDILIDTIPSTTGGGGGGGAITVNSDMVVIGGIELPGGDIQGQIDTLSGGTTTDLALKMDKVATTPLDMSGFGIANVGVLNSTTCNASSANVSGAIGCGSLQSSGGVIGSALSSTSGDIVVNGGHMRPFSTASSDLGTSSLRFRDAYLSGTVNTNAVVLPGGDVQTQIGTKFNTSANSPLNMNGFPIQNAQQISHSSANTKINLYTEYVELVYLTKSLRVDATGLLVNGDITASGNITKSYAFANWITNGLVSPLPNPATYFPIIGDSQVLGQQLSSSDMAVSFPGNLARIQYNGTPTKVFQISASISSTMEDNSTATIEYRLYKNGAIYQPSCVRVLMDGNALDPSEATMNTLIELVTGDNVVIFARNITSAVGIVVNCLNFVCTQI